MTAQDALKAASEAWQQLQHHEAQIGRLNRYTALTAGMKADRRNHCEQAHRAREVLDKVLKVTP